MRLPANNRRKRTPLVTAVLAVLALAGPAATQANAAIDPLRGAQWALDAIHVGGPTPAGAPAGTGALVAVVDSGVDASHPDLLGRVVAGPDIVDRDSDPSDPSGHGTHIAGIIAAASGNGIGGAGVAPAARILAVRVLGAGDIGSAANVAAGINAAVDAGADIINLSLNWAHPDATLAPVTAAMQRAADAGVLVVVAAGNDAQGRCEEPVLPQQALCVGSLSSNLTLSPFSSYGQGMGLVAPGDDIMSTWNNGAYNSASGTSQAAALTSGVAALLVGMGLHGHDLMTRLLATARDIGTPGLDARTGAGLLDAERAVEGASEGSIPAVLEASAPARAVSADVLKRGLSTTCDAAKPGLCRVKIRVAGAVVAKGSATADGTGPVDVVARATAAGRRALATTRALRGAVETSFAGVPGVRSQIRLRSR
jgi:serine protease